MREKAKQFKGEKGSQVEILKERVMVDFVIFS